VVYENEYMPMYITEIYSLDRDSSGLIVVRLIIVNTEYSDVLRDGEVGIS
jgi:hypothetical protein